MVRIPPKTVALRRSIRNAWSQVRLLQPAKIAGGIAISSLNVLWHGHGVLRASPPAVRLAAVAVICYLLTTAAEFFWLLVHGPRFTGFESPTGPPPTDEFESVDPIVDQLKTLPPLELREETLHLAAEMKSFEAGTDREFVTTLSTPPTIPAGTEAERDEALDRESRELMERHLRTWRAYREKFYRPARAFRDELRKRLGIRNTEREPSIPALDDAVLSGARPITQAANYLAALARRLK
jgi:hypothetical protein